MAEGPSTFGHFYFVSGPHFLQIFVELRKLTAVTDGDCSTLFSSFIRDLGRVADSDKRYTDTRLDRLKHAAQFSSMSAQEQEEYKIRTIQILCTVSFLYVTATFAVNA